MRGTTPFAKLLFDLFSHNAGHVSLYSVPRKFSRVRFTRILRIRLTPSPNSLDASSALLSRSTNLVLAYSCFQNASILFSIIFCKIFRRNVSKRSLSAPHCDERNIINSVTSLSCKYPTCNTSPALTNGSRSLT